MKSNAQFAVLSSDAGEAMSMLELDAHLDYRHPEKEKEATGVELFKAWIWRTQSLGNLNPIGNGGSASSFNGNGNQGNAYASANLNSNETSPNFQGIGGNTILGINGKAILESIGLGINKAQGTLTDAIVGPFELNSELNFNPTRIKTDHWEQDGHRNTCFIESCPKILGVATGKINCAKYTQFNSDAAA